MNKEQILNTINFYSKNYDKVLRRLTFFEGLKRKIYEKRIKEKLLKCFPKYCSNKYKLYWDICFYYKKIYDNYSGKLTDYYCCDIYIGSSYNKHNDVSDLILYSFDLKNKKYIYDKETTLSFEDVLNKKEYL